MSGGLFEGVPVQTVTPEEVPPILGTCIGADGGSLVVVGLSVGPAGPAFYVLDEVAL